MGFRGCFVGRSCVLAVILVGVEFYAEAAPFTPGQTGSVIVSLPSSGTVLALLSATMLTGSQLLRRRHGRSEIHATAKKS
jgi:hypothetical protein